MLSLNYWVNYSLYKKIQLLQEKKYGWQNKHL